MQGQCLGSTKSGARCRAYAIPGSDHCISHDPKRIVELAAYRKQGGSGRSNEARARKRIGKCGRDVVWLTGVVLDAVEESKAGRLDPKIANAIANLARVGFTALGVVDLDQQLVDMRRELAEIRRTS